MSPIDPLVLHVEDNPDDVFFMRRAASRLGLRWSLEAAVDGDEAVARLADDRRIDRVILDLKLPRRSGLEVLHWLRTESPRRGLPVVMLTSSSEDRDVRGARALGVDGYFVKPASFTDFVGTVRDIAALWRIPGDAQDLR